MKITSFLSVLALSVMSVSCGPTYFSLGVDMRNPSRSGIDLEGKNISVTYLDGGSDSLFISSVAEGFTQRLERDYFNGEQSIGIYRIDKTSGKAHASRDSMVNLVVETGADVAFLFDVESMGEAESVLDDGPFEIRLYVYDAMDQRDTVQMFKGVSTLDRIAGLDSQGLEVGNRSATVFIPSWKNRRFTVYYYESSDLWYEAAGYASDYRFREAMDIWMTLLDTPNLYKRSCAEYNIAVACCILGEKALALEWLDRSDADYPLNASYALRKTIDSLP